MLDVCVCAFPFSLTLSEAVFLCAPSDPMNFPVWYFNLFLLLAPALFFLPQFFLPMARSHATFTPSSLLLSCSLLHLLISLFFTSFQLAYLKSPSLFLSSVCSSNSASFILPCCTYCSLMSLILLLPLMSHVFVLGQCLLMGKGVNNYTICCSKKLNDSGKSYLAGCYYWSMQTPLL